MESIKYIILSFLFLAVFPSIAQEAEKVVSSEFDNMYRVSDNLYRSEQPSLEGFNVIDSMKIGPVLNLRNIVSDRFRARQSNVQLHRVKINPWRISYEDIVNALKVIRDAEKPVLVHCLHGSDRTGAVVAAYRMVFEGWSKEAAIKEFLNQKYGYHQKKFPNILELLKELDIEKLRGDLEK
jgi:protein tyrosine/serine phosphatase